MSDNDSFRHISDFLPGISLPEIEKPRAAAKKTRALVTPIQSRLIEAAVTGKDAQEILYQHTILCQTGLPYRDPGDEIREWQRDNGFAALEVTAGKVFSPKERVWRPVGLPYGPKPRLILAHINTEALISGQAEIDTERTLTRFVSHGLELDTNGRTMRTIKDQLGRLSACNLRLGMTTPDGLPAQVNTPIVSFSIWLEKDERQRVLWPHTITLSGDYFNSLQKHAVPLDKHHLMALSHSAMALDIYSWLAQRLHRIGKGRGVPLPWTVVALQFGGNYDRLRDFRSRFNVALGQVKTVYREARVQVSPKGLMLWNSPPPVAPRLFATRLGKPVE